MSLRGSRLLVTGSAGGIGVGITRALRSAGAELVCSDRNIEDASAKVPRDLAEIDRVALDVSDPVSVQAGVAAARDILGGLDGLVHTAGVTSTLPFLEMPLTEWRRVLTVNLDGAFLVSQAFARVLVEQGAGGSITLVTSQLASRPVAGKCHYASSKGALETLVRSMALELAPHGIRVNALAPGVTATTMALDRLGGDDQAMQWTLDHIPMGRLADPKEMGGAAVLLASDEASYITGTTLTVDGGYLLR